MKDDLANSKQMEKHKDEDFHEVQPYMKGIDIYQTRMCFRTICEMVNEIKGNFLSKYKRYGGEAALACDNCDLNVKETQTHCLVCPQWEDIRHGLDLTKIEDMATLFQRLFVERAKQKDGSNRAAQQDSHDS